MKINIKLLVISFFAFCCLPVVHAQITVVKQDGSLVYLDTSEYNHRVSVGDSFKIILSQEKLTNPKTGKDLGLLNHYSEKGKIIEVQELYAVGELPASVAAGVGKEAIITPTMAANRETAAAATKNLPAASQNDTTAAVVSDRKITTYLALEQEIISAVQADLSAFPKQEIATLNTKGVLSLYTVEGNSLRPLASHKLINGQKPITLSAQDVMQSGYAQLFVVVYQENEQKISTLVFDLQDQEFKQIASLPYFIKELGCSKEKIMYGQKPFIHSNKPGDVHKLSYKDGHFVLAKEAWSARGNWLTGIAKYKIQNKETENFVYTASNGRLKMRLSNGKFTDSPALFAAAPNRVKYKQEIISFYPSLQVYGPEGLATLAGIENTTKLGLLSEQFGQYNGGKLHFLTYENGSLDIQETIPLRGFVYDTNCTDRGILIPQVLSGGQTVLAEVYR